MDRVFRYAFMFYFFIIVSVISENIEVEIPQGRLRGATRINRDGGLYYSFQNIPYAKPPIGKLRFKPPEPADGWDGIRDATVDLPQCVQLSTYSGQVTGQEDCLYLNVYTSSTPGDQNTLKKPVMVFIYGGSFTSGSAQESLYGGHFLLTKDVVLVVPNYRLGVYGFLNLDDPKLGVSGNAGLKDQVQALKWVCDNIEYFGGNPDNVLLFGESAGGISVHLHILSPLSKGLFNKAIAQSGVALTNLGSLNLRNTALIVAEFLKIQTRNLRDMLQTLQNASVEELSAAELILTSQYGYLSAPVIEISSADGAFLTQQPIEVIKSGRYNQVPFMTGFNDAEGLLFEYTSLMQSNESILITDFSYFIPQDLNLTTKSEQMKLSRRIKKFYYGSREPNRNNITSAVNLYSDFAFSFPAYRTALEHVKNAFYPIYFYYFTVDAKLNFFKSLDERIASYPGASHADEMGYLFNTSTLPYDIHAGSVEDLVIKTMVSLWTNFATYGDPTAEEFAITWTPIRKNKFYFLHIGTDETYLDINPEAERMKFWLDVYRKYY